LKLAQTPGPDKYQLLKNQCTGKNNNTPGVFVLALMLLDKPAPSMAGFIIKRISKKPICGGHDHERLT
jgi:hypothetical protein